MRALPGAGLVILLGLAALPGCGGTGQVEVEGTVTYDGQPIDAEAISFIGGGEGSRNGGGTILDGKYRIPAADGPKPGKYKVEIRWSKLTGKKFKTEAGELLDDRKEGLPDKYHTNSNLTVELVPGSNVKNFELTK